MSLIHRATCRLCGRVIVGKNDIAVARKLRRHHLRKHSEGPAIAKRNGRARS